MKCQETSIDKVIEKKTKYKNPYERRTTRNSKETISYNLKILSWTKDTFNMYLLYVLNIIALLFCIKRPDTKYWKDILAQMAEFFFIFS